MMKFELLRKNAYSEDNTTLVGYQYYLMGTQSEPLKTELIYTSVRATDPLDTTSHDALAKERYVEEKAGLSDTTELSRKAVSRSSESSLIGYNYYLTTKKRKKASELLYSSVQTDNPLDVSRHDEVAKEMYLRFVKPV